MTGVAEVDVVKEAPDNKPYRHGWKTFFIVLAMLLWTYSSVMVSEYVVRYIMIMILGAEAFSQPVVMAVYSALSYIIAMLLVVLVPAKIMKKAKGQKKNTMQKGRLINWKTLGLHKWPTWTDIGLAPVGYVVYLILAGGLVALFSLFTWFDAGETQSIGFSYYVTGVDRLIAFLTLIVIAPIAEEIIFRGWLYGRMRERLAKQYSNKVSMMVSIFLVSLLFGIIHGQWNVGVNVFALSIVLCGLREITGSIHAGVLLHMLKNGIAFFLLFVMGMG